MLISCPECELQVSDKATMCPHCGYPLKYNSQSAVRRTSNRHRRLPNGFGQISEIKNRNLRKPFRAMVTVGKNINGRPICKPLKPESYFETYNDAYAALAEYNRSPYDLSPAITMEELYDKWFEEYSKTNRAVSTLRTFESAWKHCKPLYKMRVIDVRNRHIKGCMEGTSILRGVEQKITPSIKAKMKIVLNLMLDYAVEYDIVDRNYARTYRMKEILKEREENQRNHIPFTNEEMTALWENITRINGIDLILIQCYSGWRPREMGNLEVENVDLENWTFKGGMKTEAGINRVVPIHSRIRPLIVARYEEAKRLGSKYLFNSDNAGYKHDTQMTYMRYKTMFDSIVKSLNLNPEHKPHDGRKHFVTAAKKYNVDEYAIKYIIGHRIQDLTERVYTQRDLAWLSDEIEKIK